MGDVTVNAKDVSLYDELGNRVGTPTNPLYVNPVGITPQPVTQSGSWTVDVSDKDSRLLGRAKILNSNGEVINPATQETQLRRLGGGKIPIPFTITDAGVPFVYTPPVGKAIRLFWATANVDPTGGVFPRISMVLPTVSNPSQEVYRVRGAMAHWEVFEGAVDAPITISISANAVVDGTLHIEEF